MSEQTPEYDNSRQVVDDLKYLIATGCSDKTLKARIDNFAKEHALSVAQEAVEEEKAWTMYDECYAVDHVCDSILYRIKAKQRGLMNHEQWKDKFAEMGDKEKEKGTALGIALQCQGLPALEAEKLIKDYAKSKCEAQRKECLFRFKSLEPIRIPTFEQVDAIIEAPLPEDL